MRIRPLTLAAIGVLLVAYDLRLGAVDVLPDTAGWALVAVAALRLGMWAATVLAAGATVASVADLFLPYDHVAYDYVSGEVIPDPASSRAYPEQLVYLPLEGLRLLLVVAALALGGAAVTLMLLVLRRRAAASGDHQAAHRLRLLAWAAPVGWTAPYVVAALGSSLDEGSFDPVWNELQWELLALAGIAIATAVALLFASTSNNRWAIPPGADSPWGDLMVRGLDQPLP